MIFIGQDMEAAHRSKLMQGTRSLQRASESVNRSRQIAAETDEVGVNIIGQYLPYRFDKFFVNKWEYS